MAKAKVYGAVSRASKGRLKPTDKHTKESWKRRDAARSQKQEDYKTTQMLEAADKADAELTAAVLDETV